MGSTSLAKRGNGHIIEVWGNVPAEDKSLRGIKICGEAPCRFAGAKTRSKDAEEQSTSMRKLLTAVVLCVVFMTVEVVGGIKANSLAILTDAAHLLSDVAAFAISLFSIWASGWEATPHQSYGFFGIEILGAQMIWFLAGSLSMKPLPDLLRILGNLKAFSCLPSLHLV
ncbi:Cation efflux protein [Parasponia andersonii]|uniref:Cation efflux protein n=1 Tax=Parasponia andersonii TaxID=3476 RepID=A0A2P5E3I4_PARAD|nr:Cation efflux protein [Parasponia andersonii]